MSDLPELPLGLSLREHITRYIAKFTEAESKWLEAIELSKEKCLPDHQATCELVLATIESIRTELADILKFTEAEARFYTPSGSIPPGGRSIMVLHPLRGKDGNWYVTVKLAAGDQVTDTVHFGLNEAENIATALGLAIAEARSNEA